MIDKRISYRVGGASGREYDQVGSRSERDNKQESSGGGDRQEYSAQHYTAPAPKKEVEKDAREEYISEMYTPTKNIVPKEEKVITPSIISRGVDLHQGPTVKEVLNKVAEDKKEQAAITSLEDAMEIADLNKRTDLHQGPTVKEVLTDLKKKQQNLDYGQFFRPQPVVEKPKFFDTGLGKTIKNIGLGIVAPQLLAGTKLAPLYSGYRTAKTFSNVADAFGWNKPKDVIQTLTSDFITPTGLKTIDTTPKDDRKEENIMQAQAPQNIIEENIQKFSPEQLNLLRKRYAELNSVIESGEYNGQKLNDNQLNRLIDISKQMESFLVDPQKMMAAKGGLAGLHG